MDKMDTKAVPLSLAITAGILYAICAILFVISPGIVLSLFKNIFHGIDITQIAQNNISLTNTLTGFAEIIIYSLIAGWIFAVFYNFVAKRVK